MWFFKLQTACRLWPRDCFFRSYMKLLLPNLGGSSCITTPSTQPTRVNFNSRTTEHRKCIIHYIFVDIPVFVVCIIHRVPPTKYLLKFMLISMDMFWINGFVSNRYVIDANFRKLSTSLLRKSGRSGLMYVTTNRQVVCIQPSSLDEIMCAFDRHFGKHSPSAFADFLIGHENFVFHRHCARSESSVVSQTLK